MLELVERIAKLWIAQGIPLHWLMTFHIVEKLSNVLVISSEFSEVKADIDIQVKFIACW